MRNNFEHTFIQFIKVQNVPVTKTSALERLLSHTDEGSLLTYAETLTHYKIENAGIKIGKERLRELPTPFVAYLHEHGGTFTLVKEVTDTHVNWLDTQKGWRKTHKDDFLKNWQGIALLAETTPESGEKDYAKKRKNEILNEMRIPLAILLLGLTIGIFTIPLITTTSTLLFPFLALFKRSFIIAIILIVCQIASAQEYYATVTFENKDTTGNNQLLFYIFNEFGKGASGRIKGTVKIPVRKDKYDFCYISNTFSATGFLYLKHGDSIKIVQEKGWRLKHYGSNQPEYRLLEILYDNDVMTFNAATDIPSTMPIKRAIPYTQSKIARAYQIIDSFSVANPSTNKKILEMIRIDAKYRHLDGLFTNYAHTEYSNENYNLMMPIITNEINQLKIQPPYNYGSNMSWFKMNLGLSLFLHAKKQQVIQIGAKGYAKQMASVLEFYQTLPEFIREDVIFYTLNEFLRYKRLEGIDVTTFTKQFYTISANPERMALINALEEGLKNENNAKKQAEMIVNGTEIRKTQLIKPDESTTTFGELFDRLKGKGIYFDIWATWCTPCRVEMNKLDATLFKTKKTKVIFLSIDENAENWKSVVQKKYLFEGEVEHYRINVSNIILQKLLNGYVSIPKYIYINEHQTELNNNVLKPTLFNL